jgi:aryl-alcohol dehydrogenase-like predicted oxidoreductase
MSLKWAAKEMDRRYDILEKNKVRDIEDFMDDGGASIEETLEGLSDIVQAGKVRAIGISNETAWGLSEYLRIAREKGLPRVSTIQNQYSLINRTFEIGLSEICLKEGVGLLPYSPLSKGVYVKNLVMSSSMGPAIKINIE